MATMIYRGSSLALLLIAVMTLTVTSCYALEIVNKRNCDIVVFAPPICEPCKCRQIRCIRAPCPQCICTDICKPLPGVVIGSGKKTTLAIEKAAFPLPFLTVEIGKVAYVVNADDLKYKIGFTARVVVTEQCCGKGQQGLVALVFPGNPKFLGFKRICLMRGVRYGT